LGVGGGVGWSFWAAAVSWVLANLQSVVSVVIGICPLFYFVRNVQTHQSMTELLEQGARSVKSGYEGVRATFKLKPSARPLVREHSNGQASKVFNSGSRDRSQSRAPLADADRAKRMTHPPSGLHRSHSEDLMSKGASTERQRPTPTPARGPLLRAQTEELALRAHSPSPQTRAVGQRFGSIRLSP